MAKINEVTDRRCDAHALQCAYLHGRFAEQGPIAATTLCIHDDGKLEQWADVTEAAKALEALNVGEDIVHALFLCPAPIRLVSIDGDGASLWHFETWADVTEARGVLMVSALTDGSGFMHKRLTYALMMRRTNAPGGIA